jgi:hypothetical protein
MSQTTPAGLVIEEIPDTDSLYYRVHKNNVLPNGQVVPGAFKELGEGEAKGMSTDWSKYSTPELSRQRARNPDSNGIISFAIKAVREIPLTVRHAPLPENIAHAHIIGIPETDPPKTKIRALLALIYKWEIEITT